MQPYDREKLGRLHQPPDRPWHVRTAARWLCHLVVGSFHLALAACRVLFDPPGRAGRRRGARIVLTGTFFADNWVEAHVKPLGRSSCCEHLWVVADRPFVPMENVTYVSAPRWLQRLIGRIPARSIVFAITAVRYRADVVGGFHLLCNGLLALAIARMIGARAMYYCVGGWAEYVRGGVHGGNKVFTMIARPDEVLERSLLRAIRQFDLILTMGTSAREFLRECGVDVPIEVMSGALDSKRFAPTDAAPSHDLVTVSRLESVKRLDVFLDALALLSESVPTVRAAIVGDGGETDALQAQASALGLEDRVTFPGRVQDVERWLADARVFVLTSDSEGLSLALMEAMMAGRPAVVSDVGDLGDLVVDGVNGYRPPPRRPDLFADALAKLLTDEALYRRFADEARIAGLRFTVDAMSRRWDELLSEWGFEANGRDDWPMGGSALRRVTSRRGLWELSRSATRRPAGRVLSLVPPTLWLGRRFRGHLRTVKRAERWDAEQTADHQLRQVQRIVTLAYERSAYYRGALRGCGFEPADLKSLDDLATLPTIDAETVRENLASMCTGRRATPLIDRVSTGGTGGRPLHFYIEADRSAFEYAHLVASWQRIGYELSVPMAVFRGRSVSTDATGLPHEYDPLLRHHHYSTFHMTTENMRRYLEHVRGIGPCFLHVYPSAATMLARLIRDAGIEPLRNVRGVIAESEIVYPQQRAMIAEVFDCRCFSSYGHSEKLVLAAECGQSADYHVWPTYGYLELLGDDGQPVTTPGGRGEIVGTGFINRVVPFIRYRTGDHATYVGDRCDACGLQTMIIRDVRGHRTQEVLVAADHAEIPWTALNVHDETFVRVRQFQFYQDTPGRAVIRIVPAEGFGDGDRERIRRAMGRKLGGRLELDIELSDAIPLSARGKAVYVEQRIPGTSVPDCWEPGECPSGTP